ncbi:RHS repeat-associated core domain-containing protein [Streptomyces sp. 184]|uniref:RHS repeat-associated core domain-containing protein n=1 Tax=Streptomyces sp. 184 TaxID=1827526 RepID=UPI00389171FB
MSSKAGVRGLLFSLTGEVGSRGRTGVSVDYSDFAEAFGGNYASRLGLTSLPACALTTPEKPACRTTTPVQAHNDTEEQTLTSAHINVRSGETTLLAAAAAADGDQGDFKATQLPPSSTWDVSLNTGDFTWSYDVPVPEVPGGLKPNVGLAYSSGAIDGRTGNTNNQSSWIGDGFEMWPGYIERRYKPCVDDGVPADSHGNGPGDLCWGYDNAVLSFNGKAGELVPAGGDEWKLRNDDGTRIKRLTSADRDNGDNNNEYWRLTDPNGTRYYFGYHRLPGWESGKETTDSTWSVPVFGDDSDEPCHDAAGFGSSWCQQSWRWNLDYVVDTHGNAVAYYYDQEKNSYGRNLKAANNTRYTRGGTLDRIEYGLKSSAVYDKPLAKVNLVNGERCLPSSQTDCSDISKDSAYWYDTPWDLNCGETADCDQGRYSPTFFTRNRLTDIATHVLKSDGSYGKVDSWEFKHRWGQADIDYQLLLDSIQHTGHTADPAITLPKTTFAYTQLANRLDKTGDGYAPFIKARLSAVADETGGQVSADYSAEACGWADLPTPQSNTTRCFPQYIGGSDTADPERQWFNKYVTTRVLASDRTGGASDMVTRYEYLDGAAWHYDDDDGMTKEKFKTWSQWRGYGHVRVKTGGSGGESALMSQADTYFLRGMHGDRANGAGGSKDVRVDLGEGEGELITDHESVTGFAYKTVSFTGPGGKILEKVVNRPWHHQTAKRERSWGTVTANFTGTASSKTWTSLDNGAGANWRTTRIDKSYDTVAGRVTLVDDFADTSTAADNRCTRTTYATNVDANILGLLAREETVGKACDEPVDRTKDVISDTRTAYDGDPITGTPTSPTKGDATAAAVLKARTSAQATYLESRATFDAYGRKLTETDLTADLSFDGSGQLVSRSARTDGRTTTTAYTPASGFVAQIKETTPPAKAGDNATVQTSITEVDRQRDLPVKQTDTNGKSTEFAYDALGRSTKVWQADRDTSQLPTYQFNYQVTEGKPVAVATRALTIGGGGQLTSYALYDGFLRERQTQQPGPGGGRLIADTFYDERGLKSGTYAPYYADGAPAAAVFAPESAIQVETQTWLQYDGLGRVIEEKQVAGSGGGGDVLAVTTTSYRGDRTTVIPPQGGTATTSLTDARGRMTEVRYHHARSAEAVYDTTRYVHNPRGELAKVSDAAGNAWSYTYDQLGRQIEANDPDKGITTSTYDDRGQLTSTTDARGVKLAYVYDNLGRKTQVRKDSATGELRAEWVYDTIIGAKGHLGSATRYDGTAAYTSRVTAYDRLYRPMKTAVTIPAVEGALGRTYQAGTDYAANGLVLGETYSAAGSLPGGGVKFAYDEILRPIKAYGNWGNSTITSYRQTGQPMLYELKAEGGTRQATIANTYERGTQRLATSRVDRQDVPGVDKHATYTYDDIGNITSVADVNSTGTDNQCFAYDHLRRLTEAWTEPDTVCQAGPSAGAIGGPAAYWQSFTYDKTGNRLSRTDHDTSGNTAGDTRYTYTYPDAGQPQPHTLTSVMSEGPTGTAADTYTYDATGNTATRTLAGDEQTLTWDAEGHLAKVATPVEGGGEKTTEYLYDAEGNRLIGRTPTETTLYLGHTEVVLPKGASQAKATRYFDLGGGHQAVQEDDGSSGFTIADHQGTGQLALDVQTLDLQRRREQPFGTPRGEQPTDWPGTKGFVGGTTDKATGLTHLGAREYDPTTGRFISVDPLMDLTDPESLNGYTYAGSSPLTFSDPTGLSRADACGAGCPVGGTGPGTGNPLETIGSAPKYPIYPPVKQSSRSGGGDSSKQRPVLSGGIVVPSQKQLEGMGYNWSREDVAHSEMLNQWANSQCMSEPGSALCADLHALGWVSPTKDFLELIGYRDAERCADGDGGSCVWTFVGFVPFGSVGKAAKLVRKGDNVAAAALGKCVRHSFLPRTKVLLADGRRKAIEDIKIGEKVRVTEPATGKTGTREVIRTIRTEDDKHFVKLTVATRDGEASALTATTAHPFWVVNGDRWVDAGDVTLGMVLRTPEGGGVVVVDVDDYTKRQRTHDLTIDDIHTYYVLAGQTPVLVHNCGGDPHARGGAYTLRDVDGNVVRTGRTNDLQRREREHARADGTADYRFQVEYRTDVYKEQRGLEQVVWMLNGRPTLPGVRRTAGVDARHPKYNEYMDAAGQFFAKWYPGQGG